jgi:sugar lactone lactonase YvrE
VRTEPVTAPVAFHAEGPVWSERWGGLRWVDMLAGDVLALAEDGSVSRRHVGTVAAALRPRRGGGAVIAVERGFVLEDPDGTLRPLPELWNGKGVRMNDGACDPDGRFYCGSMAYDQRVGAGALYRLDAIGSVELVMAGVSLSNGLDWSPDGSCAYYVDTPTRRIQAFDYSVEVGLTRGRTFAVVDGLPDGLTVDAEGGVWVAIYGGGAVRRYSPEGTVDAEIGLPARNATACTFGGPDLDQLFITTSREGLDRDEDPLAGAVFVAAVGVKGMPAREFAG